MRPVIEAGLRPVAIVRRIEHPRLAEQIETELQRILPAACASSSRKH